MGEDLFVCDCGEATSNYSGSSCGNIICCSHHCIDCNEKFITKYGKDKIGYPNKCDRCINDTDDESEEESEENPFVCQCGGCIEPEKEEESEKQPDIIWRTAAGLEGDANHVYFKNMQDGKNFILNRMKEMLDDDQCYDDEGDLCFCFEFALEKTKLY